MKSRTLIEKQAKRKFNPELIEIIRLAKKNKNWQEIAGILSSSRRNRIVMNLETINKEAKDGETILIPGKILSQGEINKKIKMVANDFSEKAKEKLTKSKIKFLKINEEIKLNPNATGIRILKRKEKWQK